MISSLAPLFCLIPFFGFYLQAQADVYRFTGTENQDFFNEANWSPAFPGIIIDEEDQVIITSDVRVDGPLLIVKGGIRIEAHVHVEGSETHLHVLTEGWLDNRGEMMFLSIISEGTTMLQSWSVLQVEEIQIKKGAENIWMSGSEVLVAGNADFRGSVSLSGKLIVKQDLIQRGLLTVASTGILDVYNDFLVETQKDTTLRYHPKSRLVLGH